MMVGKRIRLRPKRIEDAAKDYAWSQILELCDLEAASPVSMPFTDYRRL